MMIKSIVITLTFISVTLASYGDIRILGGGSYGKLTFQLSDGTWGTICNKGFNSDAANVACKQLGYDSGIYRTSGNSQYHDIGVAICEVECIGYEDQLRSCTLRLCSDRKYGQDNYCTHADDVIVYCEFEAHTTDPYTTDSESPTTKPYTTKPYTIYHHTSYDHTDTIYDDFDHDSDDSSSSGSGVVVGVIFGGLFIFGLTFFMIICLIFYIKYSYIRRNLNRTYVVTQRRAPRLSMARVTCIDPPPPPAYTPSDSNTGYTPVPPRGFQADNVPSDPPPAYTPIVSTTSSSYY